MTVLSIRSTRTSAVLHYIRETVLSHIALKHIQAVTGYILRHEAHFRAVMEEQPGWKAVSRSASEGNGWNGTKTASLN